jgi:hypothetical protein
VRLIERYGKQVWENALFEDQRRGNCMCHQCKRMKPGEPDHCQIASKFYEICKDHGCAFILTRCEDWVPVACNGAAVRENENAEAT